MIRRSSAPRHAGPLAARPGSDGRDDPGSGSSSWRRCAGGPTTAWGRRSSMPRSRATTAAPAGSRRGDRRLVAPRCRGQRDADEAAGERVRPLRAPPWEYDKIRPTRRRSSTPSRRRCGTRRRHSTGTQKFATSSGTADGAEGTAHPVAHRLREPRRCEFVIRSRRVAPPESHLALAMGSTSASRVVARPSRRVESSRAARAHRRGRVAMRARPHVERARLRELSPSAAEGTPPRGKQPQ
jgi:hypothetical protein